jgi:hypothetical protein
LFALLPRKAEGLFVALGNALAKNYIYVRE